MKLDKYTSTIYKKIHLKQLQTSGFKRVSKKYDETVFELDLGDLLIFDGNLIHKSNFNKTQKARIVGIHRSAIFSK